MFATMSSRREHTVFRPLEDNPEDDLEDDSEGDLEGNLEGDVSGHHP